MNQMPKRVRNLRKEEYEIILEVLEKLGHLLAVNWESDLSKNDIKSLMGQRELILTELDDIL